MSSPAFLTPTGWARLREEHRTLWLRRRETVSALATAAAEGDRSENAEYIYRKKELRETDRRLRYLGRILDAAQVVREYPADRTRIRFGALVTLEDAAGATQQLRIVGGYEAEPGRGEISIDAPLARALLGKSVDDEISLQIAERRREWTVVALEYPPLTPAEAPELSAGSAAGP